MDERVGIVMVNIFTKHLHSVGETYWQHLKFAGWFAVTMIRAGIACGIHAILPFVFEKTASNALKAMYDRCHGRFEDDDSSKAHTPK